MSFPRSLTAAALSLSALALPGAAHASFTAPEPISSSGTVSEVDIATDAAGNAVAAWTQFTTSDADVYVATRPAGGAWSAPDKLTSDTPTYSGDDAFTPSVVVRPDGKAVVVWTENTPAPPTSRTVVSAAVGEAGGAFGDAVQLTTTNSDVAEPVFDAAGDLHLVYDEGLSGGNALYERILPAGSATWGDAVAIPGTELALPQYAVDLAIDAAGNAAVTWTSDYYDSTDVRAAHRVAGGEWVTHGLLEENYAGDATTHVAIDGSGQALVVYGSSRMSALDLGAAMPTWSAPADLTPGETALDLQTAPDGSLLMLGQTGSDVVVSSFAAGTTAPSDSGAVDDTAGYDRDPRITLNPAGGFAVSWWAMGEGAHVAVFGDAQGSQPEAVPSAVGEISHSVPMAYDPDGSVLAAVVRQREENGETALDMLVQDRTPPVLESGFVQTEGLVGHPVEFSAAGSEDWSQIEYRWDFGDGTGAVGADIAHAYAAPGVYAVTLTLASAGGTEVLAPIDVTIAPAPAGDGDGDGPPAGTGTPPAGTAPVADLPSAATVIQGLETFSKAPVVTAKKVAFSQTFAAAGVALWQLYLNKPRTTASAAKARKPVLIGKATKVIPGPGVVTATVKVAKKGRRSLKRAKKPAVYLRTTFTDGAGRTFASVRKVRVKR